MRPAAQLITSARIAAHTSSSTSSGRHQRGTRGPAGRRPSGRNAQGRSSDPTRSGCRCPPPRCHAARRGPRPRPPAGSGSSYRDAGSSRPSSSAFVSITSPTPSSTRTTGRDVPSVPSRSVTIRYPSTAGRVAASGRTGSPAACGRTGMTSCGIGSGTDRYAGAGPDWPPEQLAQCALGGRAPLPHLLAEPAPGRVDDAEQEVAVPDPAPALQAEVDDGCPGDGVRHHAGPGEHGLAHPAGPGDEHQPARARAVRERLAVVEPAARRGPVDHVPHHLEAVVPPDDRGRVDRALLAQHAGGIGPQLQDRQRPVPRLEPPGGVHRRARLRALLRFVGEPELAFGAQLEAVQALAGRSGSASPYSARRSSRTSSTRALACVLGHSGRVLDLHESDGRVVPWLATSFQAERGRNRVDLPDPGGASSSTTARH